jgi:hypothetical protein
MAIRSRNFGLTQRPSPAASPLDTFQPMKTWMRRRGDRVRITTGKYAGRTGVVESNVFQNTADYPTELSNGFQVMLDTGEVVIVRYDQIGDCLR